MSQEEKESSNKPDQPNKEPNAASATPAESDAGTLPLDPTAESLRSRANDETPAAQEAQPEQATPEESKADEGLAVTRSLFHIEGGKLQVEAEKIRERVLSPHKDGNGHVVKDEEFHHWLALLVWEDMQKSDFESAKERYQQLVSEFKDKFPTDVLEMLSPANDLDSVESDIHHLFAELSYVDTMTTDKIIEFLKEKVVPHLNNWETIARLAHLKGQDVPRENKKNSKLEQVSEKLDGIEEDLISGVLAKVEFEFYSIISEEEVRVRRPNVVDVWSTVSTRLYDHREPNRKFGIPGIEETINSLKDKLSQLTLELNQAAAGADTPIQLENPTQPTEHDCELVIQALVPKYEEKVKQELKESRENPVFKGGRRILREVRARFKPKESLAVEIEKIGRQISVARILKRSGSDAMDMITGAERFVEAVKELPPLAKAG
jgi:hypothetical protein